MRVLLVDDEPEIVDFLKIILERHNIESVGVYSPMEAIALAEKETFDAIVSDFKMPKMTGLEMIAHIKGGKLNAQTPTIVLSGNLTDELLNRLEKLGIIDVMSKPPEIDILIRIIEKAGRHRPKKTTTAYAPAIVHAFDDAFSETIKGHLGDKVQVLSPAPMESIPSEIEFCGVVSIFGKRLSGMLAVSYQSGFTLEFASTLLGRAPSDKELEIFETTTGEIAEQVAHVALPRIQKELGLSSLSVAPLIIAGKHAGVPLPATQPRVLIAATLNGKGCFLEFALFDLDEALPGVNSKGDVKILN